MGKAKPDESAVPPCIEAIIRLGGPTATAKLLGSPTVTASTVEAWMRSRTVPMGWVRRVAKLSGVPLEEFYRWEEARTAPPRSGGSVRSM